VIVAALSEIVETEVHITNTFSFGQKHPDIHSQPYLRYKVWPVVSSISGTGIA